MIRSTIFLLLLFLNGFGIEAYGQEKIPPRLKFHALQVQDGLPNNTINAIVQDSLGFVWIATNEGLCRYDGNEFKIYQESITKENSLSNNFVQSLFIDKKGRLWVMTDQGLNRYDMEQDHFKPYFSGDGSGLSHNSVTVIEEGNDQFFVGSYGGGIDLMLGDRFLKNYNADDRVPLASNLISDLELQDNMVLWIGTYDGGISKLNLDTEEIRNYNFGDDHLTFSGKINDIYLDDQGYLWIATDQGFSVLNTKTDNYFSISQENNSSFADNDILSLFEDKGGNIWFGTRNSGVLLAKRQEILDEEENCSFRHLPPSTKEDSVNYRSVSCFYQDKQGNIWIGTHQGGINIMDPGGEAIRYYPEFYDQNLRENQSIWGLSDGVEGEIWLGTDGNGLIQYNPYNDSKTVFRKNHDPWSLSDDAVLSLLMDSKEQLWVGTYAGGISKLGPNRKRFKRYRQDYSPSSLNSNDIRVIFEDSSRRIWIGSNGGGLQLYQEESDDFLFMEALGWLDIRALEEGANGSLWIGTFGNGLIHFDPNTNEVNYFPEIDALQCNIIFSLYHDKEGILWIGSRYKGLIRYDTKEGEWDQITTEDGLSNNSIQAIIEDKTGNLWLSTNDGLNVLDKSNKGIVAYKSGSGVQPGQFNNGSGILSKGGFLVFGGINGANILYPEDLENQFTDKDVYLTGLKLFNERVGVSTDSVPSPIDKSIGMTDLVNLEHDQNHITLDYVSPSFPKSEGINYAYTLEGLDKDWNFVGNTTQATYRNLSPGNYVFKVAVVDEEGRISSRPTSLKIKVIPPLWLKWQAIFVYILLTTLVGFLVVRYYLERATLKNSLYFEKQLRQKETLLNKERFRFFTSFSHELRTPLTLIMGPINDLIREEFNKPKGQKLRLVQRNAMILMDLINKMLEFRKTETEHNQLELGFYPLHCFIEEIYQNFKFYGEQKKIEFKNFAQREHFVWFDQQKLQLVLNNLLSNAFKFTSEGGKVSINVEERSDWLLVSVSDSGIGIRKEVKNSIFDLYFHSDLDDIVEGTGIGLALSKKLMDLHRGGLEVSSEPGNGATFTMKLHKRKKHYTGADNVVFTEKRGIKVKKPFLKENQWIPTESKPDIIGKDDKVVLIVDDNRDVVNYVSGLFHDKFKVVQAFNGQEGIDKALEFVPDLIVSDIMMPQLSGTDLCTILKSRSQTSHIPIILLTAKLENEEQLKSIHAGADAYITKPFDSEFLLARVDNLFENRNKLIKHHQEVLNGGNYDASPLKGLEDEFLKKLKDEVLKRMDHNDLGVNEIAKELGFSRSSLYRKVKAVSGLSINQFSRKVRLEKAAEMINSNGYNISEVAYGVGFNDVKYFRSCFKAQFGVLPSEYKKGIVHS